MPIPTSVLSFLEEPYTLSQEQIDFYNTHRYIKLKQVLNKETLEFFNEAIGKRVELMNTNPTSLQERSTYGKAFLQLFNLWREDETVKVLILVSGLQRLLPI